MLHALFHTLFSSFGPQRWWPAQTRFEVIIGAILTQNTSWGNVEKAIENLRRAAVLDPHRLHAIPQRELAALIKPAGYFNVKAQRLKQFDNFFIKEYNGDIRAMMRQPGEKLRAQLLSVNGIGPETADSILLYALDKPFFVVDAYTKRILERHGVVRSAVRYDDIQQFFMQHMAPDVRVFNEFHALFVRTAKEACKKVPLCDMCPLRNFSDSLFKLRKAI